MRINEWEKVVEKLKQNIPWEEATKDTRPVVSRPRHKINRQVSKGQQAAIERGKKYGN
jgi:hypothetical protein